MLTTFGVLYGDNQNLKWLNFGNLREEEPITTNSEVQWR
jgi:hypothetical protein